MAHGRAGYRDHCGGCRYFALYVERTKLKRGVFGRHMAPAHYCDKLRIFVSVFDLPQNPLNVAAGCFSYEKANGIDNEPNPKEN